METPDEENLEGETNYDLVEGWLKLLNVLHDATPIIAKNLIPEDKITTTVNENNLTYSEKFYAYVNVKERHDQLLDIDKAYVLKVYPETFLEGMDLYRLNRLLKKFFPKIHETNWKKIELLTNSRNEIVHEGKLLVATEADFDQCSGQLKGRLTELGVPAEQINRSMNIVVKNSSMYNELVDKANEAQGFQDKYQHCMEQIHQLSAMVSEEGK